MEINGRIIKFRAWDFDRKLIYDEYDQGRETLNGLHFGLPPCFETVNKGDL